MYNIQTHVHTQKFLTQVTFSFSFARFLLCIKSTNKHTHTHKILTQLTYSFSFAGFLLNVKYTETCTYAQTNIPTHVHTHKQIYQHMYIRTNKYTNTCTYAQNPDTGNMFVFNRRISPLHRHLHTSHGVIFLVWYFFTTALYVLAKFVLEKCTLQQHLLHVCDSTYDESCHIWMSHVTYEWVMSHMNESCHIWMSHVTYEQLLPHMHNACHT